VTIIDIYKKNDHLIIANQHPRNIYEFKRGFPFGFLIPKKY